MTRLVVVSNRVPSLSDGQCSGGLAVALKSALEARGGIWFGWSGKVSQDPEKQPRTRRANGFHLVTMDLTPDELHGYYEQHANRALWPLMHGRLDLISYDSEAYSRYRQVNRRFARSLISLLREGDMLWIHDYHLVPLGAELRRLGVTAPLGFFLHTPFPSRESLAALPCHPDLVDELCAYDVVGFQTADSLRNFNEVLEGRVGGGEGGRLSVPTRLTEAGHFPIGIETARFARLAASPEAGRWARRFRSCRQDQIWAVGVERLDYTKGLARRFRAFETLLRSAPELQGRLSLIQIAAPSRESLPEYQETQQCLEALSGRINARIGSLDWQPIRYVNRAFNHTQLAALFRVSRIGVVTPLRDGMNMVAKEYVASQDPNDPGVLVLSRFAGAAEELGDALLVNPYDTAAVARTLQSAAEMPLAERRRRWERMMQHLREHDVHHWCTTFLQSLAASRAPVTVRVA